MITGNQICLGPITVAATYYVQVPIACQIGTVRATVLDSSVSAPSSVVIKSSDDVTIGTATFATGDAAEKATYVPSVVTPLSTTANLDLAKNEVIQVVVTLASGGNGIFVQIELDPYALS